MVDTEDGTAADGTSRDEPPSKAPLLGAAVLAVVGLGAIGLMLLDPFGGPDPADIEAAVAADVEVDGEPLPGFEGPSDDEALGQPAPALHGRGLDGEPLTIDPADGTPRAMLFVAHWCDECHEQIRAVQEAVDGGGLHDDVDLVAVSTGVREDDERFPPGAWFREAGWTVPTLVDNADRHAAGSFGLRAYPYWVLTQGDGTVAGRLSGTLTIDNLELLMDELAERE